jgi:TetR/AcrR family transcriptional repressor of bet genes
MRRLLIVYARRLHSNLMSGLSALLPRAEAIAAADTIAAMIDGFYIRSALKDGPTDAASAARLVEDYAELRLAR